MKLYAESSAVLAWLLGEPRSEEVRRELAAAEIVVTSDLTLIECDRVLIRALTLGEITEAVAVARRAELARAAAHWTTLRLAPVIVDRARHRFPVEPVRTLDAIHLASALAGTAAVSSLAVLSLDEAIRANAVALGFDVQPTGNRQP